MKNLLIALALIAVFAAVQSMPAGKWSYCQDKRKITIALNLKYCHEIPIVHSVLIGNHKNFHKGSGGDMGLIGWNFKLTRFFGGDLRIQISDVYVNWVYEV